MSWISEFLKRRIFERDNFTCQACRDWKHHLSVHHLYSQLSRPDLAEDEDNMVTLCIWCHEKFHQQYDGRCTPGQFREFQEASVPFYDRVKYE